MPQGKITKPRRLNERLFAFIAMGANRHGTFDPEQIIYSFEEQLTYPEFLLVYDFLKWVNENGLVFGRGNKEERYKEYLEATGCWLDYEQPKPVSEVTITAVNIT